MNVFKSTSDKRIKYLLEKMKLSHNSIYLKYILFKFKIYFSILFGKKINFLNKLFFENH